MDKREKAFDEASDVRKFEIGLFWQRSLFFWGFIASAFLAYADVGKEKSPDHDLLLAIAAFGLVCSVAWTLANRGSKYWQENWEAKLKSLEEDVLGQKLYSTNYGIHRQQWWGAARFSVSRLTIALSDFAVGLWIFMAVRSISGIRWAPFWQGQVLIPALVFAYIVMMLWRCKSRNK